MIVNVSLNSSLVSPLIGTSTCFEVSPGEKVSTPAVAA